MRIRRSTLKSLILIAALFLTTPFAQQAQAQTFDVDASRIAITQVDSAWRFHLGDDPDGKSGWAQPGFDDTSWPILHPEDSWGSQGYPDKTELAWFRFHLIAPAHTKSLSLSLPEIDRSYQLFSNGQLIGQVGTLPPDRPHAVTGGPRVFTLPVNSESTPKEITIALRLWQDTAIAGARGDSLEGEVYAGSPARISAQFEGERAQEYLSIGSEYTGDIITLVVGLASLLLFCLTRERFYLWFALSLIIECAYIVISIDSENHAWGFYFTVAAKMITDVCGVVAYIIFILSALYPSVLKRSIAPIAIAVIAEILLLLVLFHFIPLKLADIGYCLCSLTISLVLTWHLVRGWRAGNFYAKLLSFPFAVSALQNFGNNFGNVLSDLNFAFGEEIVPTHIILMHTPFEIRLFDAGLVLSQLGMLAVLVYRFARTSREQQRLASALKAAHDIQNRLVPVNIPTLGGLHTEIAYRAAEEVGGDFCQILPRPDGSTFVAIGDVSGKGLQAAMLGAVAVGALRSMADEDISPAMALDRLNQVLLRTENAGFITCLCMALAPNGEVIVANAGHLSPYLDGAELALDPGLPLGIVAGITYSQSSFVLPHAARITLLSDGVVEARSASGELFGFERTTQVSRFSASEIANQAHQFGQEDDITVITLDWHSQTANLTAQFV